MNSGSPLASNSGSLTGAANNGLPVLGLTCPVGVAGAPAKGVFIGVVPQVGCGGTAPKPGVVDPNPLGAGAAAGAPKPGLPPKPAGAGEPKPLGALGAGVALGGVYVVPTFAGRAIPPLLAPPSFSCVRP